MNLTVIIRFVYYIFRRANLKTQLGTGTRKKYNVGVVGCSFRSFISRVSRVQNKHNVPCRVRNPN
ncbi:MAG: hypothetical protein LBT09_09045 [Planctomycetaceae bacterium]|nr:hypothetical protein [Planctomycetaceae bacterium]